MSGQFDYVTSLGAWYDKEGSLNWAKRLDLGGWEDCVALGHVPVQEWLSNETGAEPPLGCPVTCSRCGCAVPPGGKP